MKKAILFFSLIIFHYSNYAQETGTFTDSRDGKIYKTVKIGTQIWMAENLTFKVDSGCWAYNNDESNVPKYGRLYTYEVAKNVCPAGWHLPSKDEWITLSNYLGGIKIAGGKMKATSEWENPNTGATNESGFNALPAGYYIHFDGSFHGIGINASFWSNEQSESEEDGAFGISLKNDAGSVGGYVTYKAMGYSVRCIKD
jgi:uncharacterized protein (TIGR02145 family)